LNLAEKFHQARAGRNSRSAAAWSGSTYRSHMAREVTAGPSMNAVTKPLSCDDVALLEPTIRFLTGGQPL
jgi:hypothetical protein